MNCPDIPNLRHLRMVQIIGRMGGVSAASRQLNTSQPAVTQAVANLEEHVGAAIFERCATGTYSTKVGKLFLRRVDRFFEILEQAFHEGLAEEQKVPGRAMPPVERLITATQIRALIATSDPAAVDDAARQFNVSPASLYRSARTLEHVLGRPLFNRSATGPICNEAGDCLARSLRRAIRELEYARAEITLETGREEIEITIGALPMSGSFELANAIKRFRKRRPNATVKIITGDYTALLHDLHSCRIDMIYGVLRLPDDVHDVIEEAMFHDSYCVVARREHPLSKACTVTPAQLAEFDWIVPAAGTPRRCQIERLFDSLTRKPSFHIETNSLTYARALLYDSDLVTVATRSEIRHDQSVSVIEGLAHGYLDAVPPKGVALRADWLSTQAHSEFLDCLRTVTAGLTHQGGAARDKAPAMPLASDAQPSIRPRAFSSAA